jgi:putative ABC transport system permease protein
MRRFFLRLPFRALDSWWLDIKLGIRVLIKYPGLTLVGVFGIAVAVAIAAGGFSFMYSNFLSPSLPFEEGDRMVSIEMWDAAGNKPERRILRDFEEWRSGLKTVQDIGAFRPIPTNLIIPGKPAENVLVVSMSASGFSVTRTKPLMGRYLVADDELDGAPPVAVIGEDGWRNRFESDRAILGRTIQLGATSFSIVGVMPKGFAFPVNDHLWIPLRTGSALSEPLTGPDLMVFGRLTRDATLESAQAELSTISGRTALTFPALYAQLRPQVMPYHYPFVGLRENADVSGLLLTNLVTTMLLVAVCLNVAILVYTRTAMRQTEISIRAALGATRSRIVTQLFIEAFVLSVTGAATGVAIAAFGLHLAADATLRIASQLPFWMSFRLSPRAVLFAGLLSVLGAAIVGIAPALKATKRVVHSGARISGVGNGGMRLGGTWTVLVVAQVAFAVMLLPPAVFNAWKNLRAEMVDSGIAAEEFLTAQLGIDDAQSTNAAAGDSRNSVQIYAARQNELMRRLEAESRVSIATFALTIPGDEPIALIETPGNGSPVRIRFNRVDVDFFRAFNVPILAGRGFEPADVAGESNTVVINQSFALRVFGGDALGRRVRYAEARSGEATPNVNPGRWYEIVGIVRDFPAGVSPGMNDSQLRIYHPVAAGQLQPVNLSIRVRGGSPATFAPHLPEIAAAVDPNLQLRNVLSLDEALHREQWIRRLESAMLGGVSLSVLLLSSAGIYALMSFTVSQRRKEIGIRIALGASRKRIIASIFSRSLGQLAVGATVGIVAAAALDRGGNLMDGQARFVLPIVALFMMAVGVMAALGPARRGLRIEPTEALRED